MALRKVRLFEFCAVYDEATLQERICVVGRDENCELVIAEICNTPNEVYVAVGADFNLHDADLLVQKLDVYLVRNPRPCTSDACVCLDKRQTSSLYNKPRESGAEPCRELRRTRITHAITGHEIVYKRGFHCFEEDTRPFLRIQFSYAAYATSIVTWFTSGEKRFVGSVSAVNAGVYNVLPQPVPSFMTLRRISSFDWATIPANAPIKRIPGPGFGVEKHMYRYVVDYDDFLPCEDPVILPPPLLSFFADIETISKEYKNTESDVAEYPVGVICTRLRGGPQMHEFGGKVGKRERFVLRSRVVPYDPAGIRIFEDEADMLRAFANYVKETDPDALIGYNTNSYDYPYMLRRAQRLGVIEMTQLSRVPEYPFKFTTSISSSKQSGSISVTYLDCFGRIPDDLLLDVRKTLKLEAFKMANVCEHLGLVGKYDVGYTQIEPYFNGTTGSRMELIKYCEKDTDNCVEIEDHVDSLNRLDATCRIRRIRAKDAVERGLGFQLMMMIRPTLADMGYVNKFVLKPKFDLDEGKASGCELDAAYAEVEGYDELWQIKMEQGKYSGATVLKPKPQVIEDMLLVFDFNSLYPSIMQAYNVCHSTLLPNTTCDPNAHVAPYPANFAYCTKERREGVLPLIVKRLVEERTKIRTLQKTVKDPVLWAILEGRQIAMKVAANSVYGLLGTVTSDITLLAGAHSITCWGSQNIIKVKNAIPKQYPQAEVVYGDTDSLFIWLHGEKSVAAAQKLGGEMEDWINIHSKLLKPGLKMGFENASERTMLIGKKMYTMLIHPPKPYVPHPDRKVEVWPKLKKAGILNRSLNKYTAQAVDDVLNAVMFKKASQVDLRALVVKKATDLFQGRIADITLLRHSKNLSKPLEEYKGEQPHTIAAKQMLYAKQNVQPGDRVGYYFCDVHVLPKNRRKKSEYIVASHLVEKSGSYSLRWDFYVQELYKALEKKTKLLFECNLRHLIFSNNNRVEGIARPQPPQKDIPYAITKQSGFEVKKRTTQTTFDVKRANLGEGAASSSSAGPTMRIAKQQGLLGGAEFAPRLDVKAKTTMSSSAKAELLHRGTGTMNAFVQKSLRDKALSARMRDPRRETGTSRAWTKRTLDDAARKKLKMAQEAAAPATIQEAQNEQALKVIAEEEKAKDEQNTYGMIQFEEEEDDDEEEEEEEEDDDDEGI